MACWRDSCIHTPRQTFLLAHQLPLTDILCEIISSFFFFLVFQAFFRRFFRRFVNIFSIFSIFSIFFGLLFCLFTLSVSLLRESLGGTRFMERQVAVNLTQDGSAFKLFRSEPVAVRAPKKSPHVRI